MSKCSQLNRHSHRLSIDITVYDVADSSAFSMPPEQANEARCPQFYRAFFLLRVPGFKICYFPV